MKVLVPRWNYFDIWWNDNLIIITTELIIMDKEQLEQEIQELRNKLTGDMFQDMDLKDEIHNLEMKLKGVKPMDSHIDCVGCGS